MTSWGVPVRRMSTNTAIVQRNDNPTDPQAKPVRDIVGIPPAREPIQNHGQQRETAE